MTQSATDGGGVSAPPHEPVPDFADLGVMAFTTTRDAGSFSLASDDPIGSVMARWDGLRKHLNAACGVTGIAIAPQVHGIEVLTHDTPWTGLLRTQPSDGHFTTQHGIALVVTIADCVPVFLAHPKGAVAVLHSGWKGTADNIVAQGIQLMANRGFSVDEIRLHTGPGIGGNCFEVGADVRSQLERKAVADAGYADLKAIIEADARAAGVRYITHSASCTVTDNDRFYSHRKGDAGRQVAVIALR